MAVHFHELKIRELVRETADCVSILFEVPDSLRNDFRYREGQNITLRKMIGGEEIRRSYSICAAPHENQLKIAVKKVEDGRFSGFANESLRAGDSLEVMAPTGKFNAHLSSKKNPSYLAIAAGSGITPILSIIKYTLQQQPDSRFTLIFGNRSRSSIIFFEELQNLKDLYLERFNLIHVLSRERMDSEMNYGRINTEKLAALSSVVTYSDYEAVYLCGPEEMIFSGRDFLQKQHVDSSRIHFELFTAPGQAMTGKTSVKEKASKDSGPLSHVTVRLDGRSFEMNLAYEGMSILDAALQQGADLPYACKGGVCSTCRAKLLEGKVDMKVNYALEAEEVEQGFILTCQSHPRSETLKVDFDVK
jgi:ring-1,2-phenylacetyl-CoA epoxidase subunit PaaE